MKDKLVIIGDSEFAEIAYEYFTHDSNYEVVAFAVNREYRKKDKLFNLPVICVEDISDKYPASEYYIFVAILEQSLNRVRARLYFQMKELGYKIATYISSNAFVWHNVEVGENCFIFEDNTIQYNVKIGNDVILWSGNHIGHRSIINDHCFITSHVVVSGFCNVGEYSYFGVNSTLGHEVNIPNDTVVGAGAVIIKSLTEAGKIFVGNPAKALNKSSYDHFNIEV